MTNTLIETGARHMQQCRTNQDVLSAMCGSANALADKDNAYSMAKDELVVSCGSHLYGHVAKTATKYAYPNVITTLGQLDTYELHLLAEYYHTMGILPSEELQKLQHSAATVSAAERETNVNTRMYYTGKIKQFRHFMPVGYSVGHACAHSRNGDTVASVQIGGLRTVLNGGFDVATGDLIQMYYPDAENVYFNVKGGRKYRGTVEHDDHSGVAHKRKADELSKSDGLRKNFYTRGQGTPGKPGSSERTKNGMFSIKPYVESQNDHQLQYYGDKIRVFARAVSSARAWEPVDIMIARQSL